MCANCCSNCSIFFFNFLYLSGKYGIEDKIVNFLVNIFIFGEFISHDYYAIIKQVGLLNYKKALSLSMSEENCCLSKVYIYILRVCSLFDFCLGAIYIYLYFICNSIY